MAKVSYLLRHRRYLPRLRAAAISQAVQKRKKRKKAPNLALLICGRCRPTRMTLWSIEVAPFLDSSKVDAYANLSSSPSSYLYIGMGW